MKRRTSRRLVVPFAAAVLAALILGSGPMASVDAQESYQRISGEGSSWAANAIDAMRVNVRQFGITVDFNPSGSSAGRKNYLNGTVDFAASDIPFQFAPEDGSAPENPAPNSYVYIPVTAGGTAFMYNLKINGQQVTNLRLSGENISKIFTGVIKLWNDPAIVADNPGLTLPARAVVPVVRSDGSGASAQFTLWMIARHKPIWDAFCQASGRAPKCGSTSFYPTPPGGIAQSGDLGVTGYVSQGFAEGAIGYVNYSYALGVQFPVVKVLNGGGYYTEPTPENVAVSLLQAKINNDESNPATYLTQDLSGVYTNTDPRSYELSSYSYFILPTKVGGQFTEAKGRTLGRFSYYAMCEAQQQSASLGYSPLPVNLVTASLEQITKIPGAELENINIQACNNPTFSPDGTNVLARDAPSPQACDKQGPSQCATGTGGLQEVETPVAPAASGSGDAAAPGAAAPGAAAAGGATGSAGAGGPAAPGAAAAGGAGGGAASGGAATGGAATGGAATDPAAAGGVVTDGSDAVTGAEVCDPDTGICGTAAQTSGGGVAAAGGGAVASAGQVGAIIPTTLDQNSGWGSKQTLMLIVVLFTLGLVFIPAYAWRKMAATPASQQSAPAHQSVAQDQVSV